MSSGPILIIAYAAGGKGAVAARARTDANALAAGGHEVILVTDVARGERLSARVRVVSARFWLHLILPTMLREFVAMTTIWLMLFRLSSKVRPGCVVFHSSTLARPAAWFADTTRAARLVFVVHALIEDRLRSGSNPYGPVLTRWYQRENERALRVSDRIACVSGHMAGLCGELLGSSSKIRVVHNPIKIEKTSPSSEYSRDIDVLFVGRLSPEKGVDILIEAVSSMPELVVIIAGDGDLAAPLKASAGPHIRFLGWIAHSELARLYERAKLVVVPSRSEPQGVVVLEALASGTPVAGARVGGIPEMIADGQNGWLFKPNDSEELRALLRRLFASPDLLRSASKVASSSIVRFDSASHLGRIKSGYFG